jgi:hypothetical protein
MNKPRLVEITDHHELARLWETRDELGSPHIFRKPGTADQWGNSVWVDAEELRAWRSANTSGEAK